MAWLAENITTIIICFVLVLIVALAVFSIVRDKKKGKSCCGGSCGGCSMNGACHKK